jgi:hypothetical protein
MGISLFVHVSRRFVGNAFKQKNRMIHVSISWKPEWKDDIPDAVYEGHRSGSILLVRLNG